MLLTLHEPNTNLIKYDFLKNHIYLDNDELLNIVTHHLYLFHETPAKYCSEDILKRLYEIGYKTNQSKLVYEFLLDMTTADLLSTNTIYDLKDVSYIIIQNPINFSTYLVNFLFMYILNEYHELYNEDEVGCYSYISEDVFLQVVYCINTIRKYNLIHEENWGFVLDVILNELLNKIVSTSEHYGLYYKNSVIVIERKITIEDYGVYKKYDYIEQLKKIIDEEYNNYDHYIMKIRR